MSAHNICFSARPKQYTECDPPDSASVSVMSPAKRVSWLGCSSAWFLWSMHQSMAVRSESRPLSAMIEGRIFFYSLARLSEEPKRVAFSFNVMKSDFNTSVSVLAWPILKGP